MNVIDILRSEYPGDDSWSRLVDAVRPGWEAAGQGLSSFVELEDEELAIVLSATLGTEAATWYFRPCSALEQKSPSEVLKTGPRGLVVLRALLMRMPR